MCKSDLFFVFEKNLFTKKLLAKIEPKNSSAILKNLDRELVNSLQTVNQKFFSKVLEFLNMPTKLDKFPDTDDSFAYSRKNSSSSHTSLSSISNDSSEDLFAHPKDKPISSSLLRKTSMPNLSTPASDDSSKLKSVSKKQSLTSFFRKTL